MGKKRQQPSSSSSAAVVSQQENKKQKQGIAVHTLKDLSTYPLPPGEEDNEFILQERRILQAVQDERIDVCVSHKIVDGSVKTEDCLLTPLILLRPLEICLFPAVTGAVLEALKIKKSLVLHMKREHEDVVAYYCPKDHVRQDNTSSRFIVELRREKDKRTKLTVCYLDER